MLDLEMTWFVARLSFIVDPRYCDRSARLLDGIARTYVAFMLSRADVVSQRSCKYTIT
jgi:hypothetical protein